MFKNINLVRINKWVLLAFVFLLQARAYSQVIRIETAGSVLVLSVGENKKLYQTFYGPTTSGQGVESLSRKHEAYIPSGTDNLFEPAIRTVHSDGNPSLELKYATHQTELWDENVKLTKVVLTDPEYPVEVTLNFLSFFHEDVIKTWTEIKHQETKPIVLTHFASSMIHLDANDYWLTQFHAREAGREMTIENSQLTRGIKIIDSKLGTRAHQYNMPGFYLSLNEQADENKGELVAGTLAWTGNFRCLFEIDNTNSLRVLAGINPFASEYSLEKGKPLTSPAFIFTYSREGKGRASRNLHSWGRKYGVLNGDKPRITLLNNWETTTFNFDESRIEGMLADTKNLGVKLFLLDDGWFGNKYPRFNDKAGLGDWQVNKSRFPRGLSPLISSAENKGIKFGIWIEPEMVNPKSVLYEKHPDWILKLPNRAEDYQRNQLVLDLSNPKVQDFIYETLDKLLSQNPGIAFVKWDCNRRLTNAYSPYLKSRQSHLQIEYNFGLYKVLERLRSKYPDLPMMLCSAGGGRTDYGALQYFNEFWPSDNTDPLERIFIQWGYSHFFPVLTSANHVTSMSKQPIKFRTDVAMMGRLGYDINVSKLSPDELKFSQDAVQLYHRISDVICKGDMYRLVSPYEENRAVLMFVDDMKSRGLVFAYNMQVRLRESFNRVRLEGLVPERNYKVQEINLMPNSVSKFQEDGKVFSGAFLMNVGLPVSGTAPFSSAVYELIAHNQIL